MHHDYGRRQLAGNALAVGDCLVKQCRVKIPRLLLAVDENRFCAQIHNRIAAGRECHGLAYDLVAGLDSGHCQAQVYGSGSGRERDGMSRSEKTVKPVFKLVYIRPEGHYPCRLDNIVDIFLFFACQVRQR